MLLMTENSEDLELTINEAAALLRVSEDTVRPLLVSGEIPAWKQGRSWRIPKSGVEAYKQKQRDKRKK